MNESTQREIYAYCRATGASTRKAGELFGVSNATVSRIIKRLAPSEQQPRAEIVKSPPKRTPATIAPGDADLDTVALSEALEAGRALLLDLDPCPTVSAQAYHKIVLAMARASEQLERLRNRNGDIEPQVRRPEPNDEPDYENMTVEQLEAL